ncbi:ACP S-malonyltransferase [Kitasatospora sp. NPDC059463]|uniref:ACP S-malonyltransferase n=1 Tax=unclassified Kitasatospora TaxID=2633591 RepID=UPI0036AA616E
MNTGAGHGTTRPGPGGVVFLVPGQGSHPAGALAALHRDVPAVRAPIDRVLDTVDAIAAQQDFDPVRNVLLGPDRPLPLAPDTPQLAHYAAAIALDRALAAVGIRPKLVVGQSFGEIAALVCAEAFDVADGARAVCAFNHTFRPHEGTGAMVLVKAGEQDTLRLLDRTGRDDLVLACLNTPRQSIVSGPNTAITALLEQTGQHDVPDLLKLPMPYGMHHPSLGPSADRFLRALRPLPQRPLRTPVLSPVRRRRYTDADDLHRALADCVTEPVHLLETLRRLPTSPDVLFVEVGVGDTLCRCLRAVSPDARTVAPLSGDPGRIFAGDPNPPGEGSPPDA